MLSEIGDNDDIDIIIGFLMSDNETNLRDYADSINKDSGYVGIFLDGNQYIISNDKKEFILLITLLYIMILKKYGNQMKEYLLKLIHKHEKQLG